MRQEVPTTAATTLDRAAEGMVELVGRMPGAACILAGLPRGRIVATSPPVAGLLGVEPDELLQRTVSSFLRELWRSESMRLLVAGAQHGFVCPTTLRVANGQLVACTVAVRHLRTAERRWVFIVVDVDRVASGDSTSLRHRGEDVVAGVGDGEGGIGDVSHNIADLLGYDAPSFVSRTVAGLMHVDDYPNFVTASQTAITTRRTTSLEVRMRHADGAWVPVRLLLAPMGEGKASRLAFVLVPATPPPPDGPGPADAARLEEVEQRLRRIALEIAALGVGDGLGPAMAPEVALALGQLSPKRQEIVARLRDGERVPSIAEHMFLSQSTIRNHLSATFRHFGVASQEELIRLLRGAHRPGG